MAKKAVTKEATAAKVGMEDLMGLIENATDADLATIDNRIQELRAEVDEFTKPRQATIDSLMTMRRMIDKRLHPIPRKKPGPRKKKDEQPKDGPGTMLQESIYDLLSKEGSLPVNLIAAKLASKPLFVENAVKSCKWFSFAANGNVAVAMKNGK